MPRVAAVLPCYNQGQYLEEAIDSILAQSYEDVNILVVNDGSTDPSTIDLLHELHKPKTVVLHRSNGHAAAARNHGIRHSQSEYVLVLDADDRLGPGFLERAIGVLDRMPEVGVVSSWVKTFGLGEWVAKPEGGGVENFLHKNNCPSSALFRRQCWEDVGGYNESMRGDYEDWDFYLSVTERGWRVEILPEPYYHYRVAESSSNTRGYGERLRIIERLVTNHLELYQKHVTQVVLQKEKALLERNEFILQQLLEHPELAPPEVTYGDGGVAFRVAVETARRARSKAGAPASSPPRPSPSV